MSIRYVPREVTAGVEVADDLLDPLIVAGDRARPRDVPFDVGSQQLADGCLGTACVERQHGVQAIDDPSASASSTHRSCQRADGSHRRYRESGARNSQPAASPAVGVEPQIRQAIEQDLERGPRGMPPEPGAQAEVVPGGEGQVRALFPVDVEPIRVGEPARVAVRDREHRADQRVLVEFRRRRARRLRSSAGWTSPRARSTAASPRSPASAAHGSRRTSSSASGCVSSAQIVSAIRSRGSWSPPDSISLVFATISSRVMRSSPSCVQHRGEHRAVGLAAPGGRGSFDRLAELTRWPRRPAPASRDRPRSWPGRSSSRRSSAERSSHGTSSSPSMKRSEQDRHRLGQLPEQVGLAPAPRTRRSARARAPGSCRRCAPRPRADETAPRRRGGHAPGRAPRSRACSCPSCG